MSLSHIPQCTVQDRNVHISVLNGALRDLGQVHCGISEYGLFASFVSPGCYTGSHYNKTRLRFHSATTCREINYRLKRKHSHFCSRQESVILFRTCISIGSKGSFTDRYLLKQWDVISHPCQTSTAL